MTEETKGQPCAVCLKRVDKATGRFGTIAVRVGDSFALFTVCLDCFRKGPDGGRREIEDRLREAGMLTDEPIDRGNGEKT